MNYKSKTLTRRDFLKIIGKSAGAIVAGAVAGEYISADPPGNDTYFSSSFPRDPSGVELVEDVDILKNLSKVYRIFKKYGDSEKKIDVNGDGKLDTVNFNITEGSVRKVSEVIMGKKFEIVFETGDGWSRKIYGIVGNKDEISLSRTEFLTMTNAKKYVDVVLEDMEKKD